MPEYPKSAIGTLAELQEGQIALPRFVVQNAQGLLVKPALLSSASEFADFVNRVLGGGFYFRGLDYPSFLSLLYDDPASRAAAAKEIFLASDITTFRAERQALYKALRIEGEQAVYMFQPVFVDTGDAREEERTYLDVDEFIASAWLMGVRFGIDMAAVRAGIAAEKAIRLVVAAARPFVPGKDAEIEELAPGLRRNNAPRQLLGGKVDLRSFETRYPQVAVGMPLVKKIPRVAGTEGRDIAGAPLLGPLPKDFDLAALAGPGTKVNLEKDGEYLVAAGAGFLNVDTKTNQFSISEKIVSHEGVSARTTGDLSLSGEAYEQHGEIQEKRIVHCRSITAYGAVFGRIVSSGGLVCLKNNLVGGSADNEAGDIVVEGVASGATLVAHAGRVTVRRADNCVLLAREVVVEHALNCDIVADEVHVELAEGCALAGKSIHVQVARSRREIDNVLLAILPDLSGYATQIAAMRAKQEGLAKTIAGHRARMIALRNEKEVANYLTLAGKLRRHEMELKPEQEVGWRRLAAQVAPALRTLSSLNDSIKHCEAELQGLEGKIAEVASAREQACRGVSCTVERPEGETRISTLQRDSAEPLLRDLPPKELKARLRRTDVTTTLLFAGSGARFDWIYRPPPA